MKAIVALVCLVAVVVAQETSEAPAVTNPPVDCDVPPSEEDWAVILPDPKDCGNFYICEGFKPILMHCPKGLHFNPELLVCDWPASANCTANGWGNELLP